MVGLETMGLQVAANAAPRVLDPHGNGVRDNDVRKPQGSGIRGNGVHEPHDSGIRHGTATGSRTTAKYATQMLATCWIRTVTDRAAQN
jgi:hypothetical protein